MSKPRVYLAGPITGLDYGAATDWRADAREWLADKGIDAFSPLRAKTYLRGEAKIDGAPGAYQGVHPLSAPPGICARDRWDVTRTDVVLLNLWGATRVSIGSMIEVGWADAARVPIVLVVDPPGSGPRGTGSENPHDHAMVYELCPYVVPTLEAGLEIVRALVLP